ncbi:unnamed protein product [Alopecurus aequalis]
MAPSWVLLDRVLLFSHDEAVFAGETEGGRESTGCASDTMKGPPTEQDYSYAITAYLQSLKPDARLADPPELSSLRMLQPTKSVPPLCDRVTSACISSADKHLVALYAGAYRPGTHYRGCHLIYDASKNSLSTIPRLPYRRFHTAVGCHSAVVVCDGDGAGYTLAELSMDRSSDVGEAALYLLYPNTEEWVVKAGFLPLPRTLDFSAGMCFHCRGTSLCWVDLLQGMVVCDLSGVERFSSDPKFRFVPLPAECPTYGVLDPQCRGWQICGEEFRSVSCVGGVIQFVAIDGYVDRRPEEAKLILWTLSPDLEWVKGMVYEVEKIWGNKIYQSTGIGKVAPSFPVLSMYEAHVVYLVFTDIRAVASNFAGTRVVDNNEVECRGQYVIRLDMKNGEVQLYKASTKWLIHSQLFASEFSAYRQGLEDHPGGRSKQVTTRGKRMKL